MLRQLFPLLFRQRYDPFFFLSLQVLFEAHAAPLRSHRLLKQSIQIPQRGLNLPQCLDPDVSLRRNLLHRCYLQLLDRMDSHPM